jgi:hypothetical protein
MQTTPSSDPRTIHGAATFPVRVPPHILGAGCGRCPAQPHLAPAEKGADLHVRLLCDIQIHSHVSYRCRDPLAPERLRIKRITSQPVRHRRASDLCPLRARLDLTVGWVNPKQCGSHSRIRVKNNQAKSPPLLAKRRITRPGRKRPCHTLHSCPLVCASCAFCGHSSATFRMVASILSLRNDAVKCATTGGENRSLTRLSADFRPLPPGSRFGVRSGFIRVHRSKPPRTFGQLRRRTKGTTSLFKLALPIKMTRTAPQRRPS